MQNLLLWWDSIESVSILSTVLKCAGAAIGVLILIVGFRESDLRGRAQAAEKQKWNQDLKEARTRADEAVSKQQPRVLSGDQIQVITQKLHEAVQVGKATIPIVVTSRMMDAESLTYGRQILAAI